MNNALRKLMQASHVSNCGISITQLVKGLLYVLLVCSLSRGRDTNVHGLLLPEPENGLLLPHSKIIL